MAFDTDCGVPTVLEAIRVASTAGPSVPGECRVSAALTVGCEVFCDPSEPL